MPDDSRLRSPRARWIALVVVCLGQLMSVAVLGTVSTDHTRTLVAHGTGLDAALLSGCQLAFRIGAAGVAVALLPAVLFVRSPRRAEIVAETLAEPEPGAVGERGDPLARASQAIS